MPDKNAEELLREKVVEAQEGGRIGALSVVPQSQALSSPAAPVLRGPPTETELAPMLRDMQHRLRREQARLDERILSTTGQEQAQLELQRVKAQYLYERDKDRLMERRESRETRKSRETADYLVDDMNTRFGAGEVYFRPPQVGDTIE